MAKVWFCREGDKPTLGGPSYTLTFEHCIQKLRLSKDNFLCDLSSTLRFGKPGDPLANLKGNQYVVVEIEMGEAKGNGCD